MHDLTFKFEGRWYSTSSIPFRVSSQCTLPDGRVVKAGLWLDDQPGEIEIVPGAMAVAVLAEPPHLPTQIFDPGLEMTRTENHYVAEMPVGPDHFQSAPLLVHAAEPELAAIAVASLFASGGDDENAGQHFRIFTTNSEGDKIEWTVARHVTYSANRIYLKGMPGMPAPD